MLRSVLSVLIVDDDEGDRRQVVRALHQWEISCVCVEAASIEEALHACDACNFNCAVIDYKMPGQDGLKGIELLHARMPEMSIIMATGHGDEMIAIEAMKRGASDYIPKKLITSESIRIVIEGALEKDALRHKVVQQRDELENFARVLAHDLKAPIQAIYGIADFIEISVRERKWEKISEDCQNLIKAVQRMDTLINTLAEYTKIDAQIDFGVVQMNDVLEDAVANLGPFIQAHHAIVTHGDLPAIVGNAAQLTQLFQNLVNNGIKYCEELIPTVHIEAREQEATGSWLFSVRDNGIGIPRQYLRSVFESFKRLHANDKYEGTGLGLATCMKIIKRHGGSIWCESEEGAGSTFFFTLPKAETGAQEGDGRAKKYG